MMTSIGKPCLSRRLAEFTSVHAVLDR